MKHYTLNFAYSKAAPAQPTANATILIDMRANRLSGAPASGLGPCSMSARSIITCVVVPVINVDGGALPR